MQVMYIVRVGNTNNISILTVGRLEIYTQSYLCIGLLITQNWNMPVREQWDKED